MPRPVSTNPRLVARGDTVRTKADREEVVRFVSVVLHLADGTDEVYTDEEKVKVVPTPRPVDEADVAKLGA